MLLFRVLSIEGGSTEVELTVQPCFSGPFNIPEGYDKASPVYMIKESKRSAMKIIIDHHTSIENEEDSSNMVFLQGDISPKKEKLYDFHVMDGGDPKFEIGSHSGEITVQKPTSMCVAKKRSMDGRL